MPLRSNACFRSYWRASLTDSLSTRPATVITATAIATAITAATVIATAIANPSLSLTRSLPPMEITLHPAPC